MVRFALAAAVCLALVACKKDPPAPPADEKGEASGPAAVVAQEPAEEKLDEAGLNRYLGYEKDLVARMPAHLAKYKAVAKEAQSGKGGAESIEKLGAFAKEVDVENEKALEKAKLSPGQLARWDAIVTDVIVPRSSGAAAAMQNAANDMRVKAKTLPPDEQEAAQAAIKELESKGAETNGQTEARKQYGDAAVDLVLKHEAELKTLHDQRLAFFTQLGGAGAGDTK